MHNYFTHDFCRVSGSQLRQCIDCGDIEPAPGCECDVRPCPGPGTLARGMLNASILAALAVFVTLLVLFSMK